ncbi:Tn3 family transposase [Escherichia coli]
MQKYKKRISILTKSEINELYQVPSFNPVERDEFFSLDISLKREIDKIINIESRVYLILITGYFRYKPVIPEFTLKDVKRDVKYIIQTYYKNESTNLNLNIPKSTKYRLVKRMLSTLGFEQLTPSIKNELSERLNDVATICMEPKYIFDELLAFLGQRRIALPGYSTVQNLVSDALNFERKRTINILSKRIYPATAQKITSIIHDDGILNSIRGYNYSTRDFSASEIENELRTHNVISSIYYEIKDIINSLGISQGNMEYYATIIGQQITAAKDDLRGKGKLDAKDLRVIHPSEKNYIVKEGEINTQRFEFHMYSRVSNHLENGVFYAAESEQNKRLEDDLIERSYWHKNKSILIEKTGLERLITPITQTLNELENTFSDKLARITIGINSDANEFVKKQPHSNRLQWSLASKKWKTSIDNPIYNQIKNIGIVDVMKYVNNETNFLSVFNAISSRKNNLEADYNDLLACIFGNGANYGVHRMASASDRSIGILRDVNDKFIRPETTGMANTVISDAIANLSVYKYWTINEDSPFGSVDGQKHTCRINTFKARYSAKYFRKGKGVSAMTLVSNHVPLSTVVISPNEYEGHFAFDLLYNNTSEIQPKSLATDNHGINNVNFAILDIFGYQFSPRYAKFKKIFNELFDVILESDKLIIKLKKQFNFKLIEHEWENIQHIICSLSRKTTIQSTVVKKLSNTKRSNKTLAALREYDRVIKCIYVLDYADNKTLRQFVQQALNRGEAYHQLRRAIASVNGNQFRGGNDYQIDQWNDCARLIANCVIYYNSAILSRLVEKFEKENNKKAIDVLANLSPVAWRHILLGGNYSFEDQVAITNLDSLLEGVDPLSDIGDIESEYDG